MPADVTARFLFEIASPERLGILAAVAEGPRKHSEIARRLSMTGSETTRHLVRLARAGLVVKTPDATYAPTPLAEALLAALPFFDFLVARRSFLLAHRVDLLEPPFIARLGELSAGSLVDGTFRVVGTQEESLLASRRRIWVLTEQRFDRALPILRERAAGGTDVRVIRCRSRLEEERRSGRDVARNFPLRVLTEPGLFLAVLDDSAGLCLPGMDGKVDLGTMLLVTDPRGYRWSEDLFLSLWNRAGAPRGGPPPSG